MAFALVQTVQQSGTGTVDAVTSAVGASGRILRMGVFWQANSALTTIETRKTGASTGDTITAIGSRQWVSGVGYSFQEFVALAPTSGIDDVRATLAATAIFLIVQEYSGFTGTPEVTGTPVYTFTTTSNSSATSTVTTADTNAILLASCFPSAAATSATGTGWTTDASSGGSIDTGLHWGDGCIGHAFLASTGSKGPITFTTTSGTSGDENVIYAIGDNTGGPAFVARPIASNLQAVNTAANW